MQIQSMRAKEIDAYLARHDAEGKWPIELNGTKKVLPYYKFPLSMLRYNRNNGRLAMEVSEWERTNGRSLDPGDPADSNEIADLLLRLDQSKTELLKEDIQRKGQMEPGVISHDGVVINANRRMAIFQQLHAEEPTGRWEFLEAVRLPEEVSERDLWKIEAGLQLSGDKKAEYHPVNELLKLREGIQSGLKPQEIAAAMYNWDADKVIRDLDRLKLIDSFLLFMGNDHKNNYGLIKKHRLHEYFIDIQNQIIRRAQKDGLPSKEVNRRLQLVFALLRANIHAANKDIKGLTHWDMRKLDKIFADPYATEAFSKPIETAKNILTVPATEVLSAFRESLEVLQMREEQDKPIKLVDKATKALEIVSEQLQNNQPLRNPEVLQERLTNLRDIVQSVLDRTMQ